MKKILYPLLIALIVVSGFMISTVSVFSNPPEPQCVCAECGRPCGSGHASTCSSKQDRRMKVFEPCKPSLMKSTPNFKPVESNSGRSLF